jgi:electron transfer flavoprotein alpha subunit
MASGGGVWVLAGLQDGVLRDGTLEVIGEARKVAEKTGQGLTAVLPGEAAEDQVSLLGQHGVARVLVLDHPSLEAASPEIEARLLSHLIREHAPSVVVAIHSIDGADLAGRLAAGLGVGLVTACDRLDVAEDGRVAATKPVYGNKAAATLSIPDGAPQMATVNPDSIDARPPDPSATAEVVKVSPDASVDAAVTRVVDFLAGDPRSISLTEAEIVVAGGMGLGSGAGFKLVQNLADAIGGSVGATRRVVDEEWIEVDRQVGLTGKTVRPKLYIACGISGAIQHTMGMKDAKAIVAINTDRNAPIFKMADVGVVADVLKVLPVLTARLREALADGQRPAPSDVVDALGRT